MTYQTCYVSLTELTEVVALELDGGRLTHEFVLMLIYLLIPLHVVIDCPLILLRAYSYTERYPKYYEDPSQNHSCRFSLVLARPYHDHDGPPRTRCT